MYGIFLLASGGAIERLALGGVFLKRCGDSRQPHDLASSLTATAFSSPDVGRC